MIFKIGALEERHRKKEERKLPVCGCACKLSDYYTLPWKWRKKLVPIMTRMYIKMKLWLTNNVTTLLTQANSSNLDFKLLILTKMEMEFFILHKLN